MEKITRQLVEEAYQKSGLSPINGAWIRKEDNRECGCAVTALMCASGKMTPDSMRHIFASHPSVNLSYAMMIVKASEVLELPTSYIRGFVYGFDGLEHYKEAISLELGIMGRQEENADELRLMAEGYSDGKEAAGVLSNA